MASVGVDNKAQKGLTNNFVMTIVKSLLNNILDKWLEKHIIIPGRT